MRRGFDINTGRWRDVPADRWTVEWQTEPVRPAGLSDDDWQLEIECSGHDLAICHIRECRSEAQARALAASVAGDSWYGVAQVQREVPDFINGSAFFWEPAGDLIEIESVQESSEQAPTGRRRSGKV